MLVALVGFRGWTRQEFFDARSDLSCTYTNASLTDTYLSKRRTDRAAGDRKEISLHPLLAGLYATFFVNHFGDLKVLEKERRRLATRLTVVTRTPFSDTVTITVDSPGQFGGDRWQSFYLDKGFPDGESERI